MIVTSMVETVINDRWTLILPEHRSARAEWPTWERERLAAMHDTIRPADVVIDIGAEEGDFPALWSLWGAHVVLFEPNPLVWPNIRAIWRANDLEPPVGWFVGFASDVTDLHPPDCDVRARPDGGWPQCAYGHVIDNHGFRHLSQQIDTTPQVTLDDWCDLNGVRPDVLTIDVEGSELRVLHGADRILTECHPTVFVSVHTDEVWMDEQYDRVREADVTEWMEAHGYAGEHLATDHEAHWVFR